MLVGIYNNGTTALNDFSGTLLVNQAVSGSSAIGSTIGIYGPDITLDNFTGTIYAGRYLDDDLELGLPKCGIRRSGRKFTTTWHPLPQAVMPFMGLPEEQTV